MQKCSSKLSKEEIQKLNTLLDELEKDDKSIDFLEPVNYIKFGLNDYPLIVKKPMDLSTVRKNAKNAKYTNIIDVIFDINLIWENCKAYNMEGSEIYMFAEHMEKLASKLTEKYFKTYHTLHKKLLNTSKTNNVTADFILKELSKINSKSKNQFSFANPSLKKPDYSALNLEEKVSLHDEISQLNEQNVGLLLKFIAKECPSVLHDLDEERFQIRMDLFTKDSHAKVIDYMNTLKK